MTARTVPPIGLLLAVLGTACGDPSDQLEQTVDFRDGVDDDPQGQDEPTTGERGTVKIAEINAAGTVRDDGTWDPSDVWIELRNEGARPINLSRWRLEVEGPWTYTTRIPTSDRKVDVGEHVVITAKADGCVVEPDLVASDLRLPTNGDAFQITLLDADEHLIDGAGSDEAPPFAGGYDGRAAYAMERIHLMFGQNGGSPQVWQFHNRTPCPNSVVAADGGGNLSCFESIPNNDRLAPDCRRWTYATPGRPNSPDYSGAYASGGFD